MATSDIEGRSRFTGDLSETSLLSASVPNVRDRDGERLEFTFPFVHDAKLGQGRPIVNGERPALLPEELRREPHVPVDARFGLRHRRVRGIGAAGAVDR